MSQLTDEMISVIQQKINNKGFDQSEEKNISKDFFGGLSGTRFSVNGNTQGSDVSVVDDNTVEIALNLGWTYFRKEYRGSALPPIDESRTDTGKFVFRATASIFEGIVINEVRREASTGDPNHDSARVAFNGLMEDIVKPSFRIK
jgi:hypothetical protein